MLHKASAVTGLCYGCWRKLQPNRRMRPFEALYSKFLKTSIRRNIKVLLSYEEFVSFTSITECHYCGRTVHWSPRSNSKPGRAGYNLDRKYNDKPYAVDNVVVCCARCNYTKGRHYTYEEMMILAPVLRELAKRSSNDLKFQKRHGEPRLSAVARDEIATTMNLFGQDGWDGK
jgi:hypothetical protein